MVWLSLLLATLGGTSRIEAEPDVLPVAHGCRPPAYAVRPSANRVLRYPNVADGVAPSQRAAISADRLIQQLSWLQAHGYRSVAPDSNHVGG
ncbi:MAG: hypothetical protein KDK91_32245, partial [Gammaproteobacteria bacterium]|nr:hypothetical protein [Gammaproteobacteria bacterium]